MITEQVWDIVWIILNILKILTVSQLNIRLLKKQKFQHTLNI